MNLEQLRYFIDVCETGNISQSAKKFYISPQGMNKSLRSLEKELGIELFVFQQRKTEMSELGKLYYTQIKDLVHQLTKINEDISMKQAKTLKVALSNNTYSMVSQMINSFMQTYPQITITLSEYPDKLVEEKLHAQEVDIAFICGPSFITLLRSARLFTDVNKLCIPKGHRLEGREYVTFQDLANEPFLAMNENYKIYD